MIRYFCFSMLMFIAAGLTAQNVTLKDLAMKETRPGYGIVGQQAPELKVDQWIGTNGEASEAFQLADHEGKFKVIYCFQAWCPGCHSRGLPSLQEMSKALEGSDKVVFAAIQTVFEGKRANTYERMIEIQEEYGLNIPFGHDTGLNSPKDYSATMQSYRTGGTPWFILIDANGKVVFNDYHLNTEKAIEFLKAL